MEPLLKVSREYGDTMPVEHLISADSKETKVYSRKLEEGERASINQGLADITVRAEVLAEERKSTMDDLRQRKKALEKEQKRLVKAVRTGQIDHAGVLYTYLERERGKAHIYNENGVLMASRRMTPEEAQLQIGD
jgi:hypothetical protein